MREDLINIISHVSVGTNDIDSAIAFYDALLASVGAKRLEIFPGGAGYGKSFPQFWVHAPDDGKAASVGNGSHVSFMVSSSEEVRIFYEAALTAGAKDEGPPGPRPDYGPQYYGCFVRDLDGNKIEASFWDESAAD